MRELILLLFFLFVALPIGLIAVIVHLIVKLVKRYRKRKELFEQSNCSAESFVYSEPPKPIRKFNGSEIMFIMGQRQLSWSRRWDTAPAALAS